MYVLILAFISTLICFVPGLQGQLASSSTTGVAPAGTTKPLCGAFNVMELCVRTNTEKQAGCIAFPDSRLCQCQYQQAVVTCYDLCKSDIASTGERPRAEADAASLCQGYNNSQIFPVQQGNPASQSPVSSFPPSKPAPGQGVSTGSNSSHSLSPSIQVEIYTRISFVAFITLVLLSSRDHII
ncbi:hypothetical protein K493DRAFT_332420 [Basidiobolus meristosporus CBS 931.73]|uniref:Extracellular membrane protein CFEM domain-containing protein n=1 Tax=Basidiobolus meristosporus CBS 931.73 TaxID=1314790 RepID=A0A1Y1ZDC5_9FUNG|nr:hypothetical protein K493DRAFT_332420 [Basidiobolus meristosporus CBS 931.73]|eukprot:ORY08290.1 hypothetical protein K493DRAFT_332420 [Basidiobolus meristosporus CBS 931.73]